MRPPFVDHLTLTVSDYERSQDFYHRALEPWGVRSFEVDGPALGIGPEESGDPSATSSSSARGRGRAA